MKYIIKTDRSHFVAYNLEDAKHIFDALLNCRIVETDYKYENEKFTVQESFKLEIIEVRDNQVIEKVKVTIPNPVDSVDTKDEPFPPFEQS